MSANGIAHLATRELRQKAKLNLAAIKRAARSGHRDTAHTADDRFAYDLTELPAIYSGNSTVDNPNVGGLVEGRPWISIAFSAGVYRSTYGAYYNGTKAYFNTASVTATAVATNFEVSTSTTNFSYQYLGYIKADYTGTWTFAFTTDDYCHIWIGPDAVPPPQLAGAENAASPIGSGTFTVDMVAGAYYPVKVMYGNNGGPGQFSLSWNRNGSGASTNWAGKLFYNTATNGF